MAAPGESSETAELVPVIFVSHAGSEARLQSAIILAESIRTFGGQHKQAPIWIYTFQELIEKDKEIVKKLEELDVDVKYITIPEELSWFYLSGMVVSAAQAETEAAGVASVIVFVGSDTIFLDEPKEMILADNVIYGYRPAIHRNINPLYSDELDRYWSRAYSLMKIDESTVFKMVTPADGDTVRPYFNAGSQVLRPESGLFNKWKEMYFLLCQDSIIKEESEKTTLKRVFTFQVALIGTILNNLKQSEIVEFSERYNYPIFFKEMFNSKRDFHDITDVVTIRHEDFFEKPLENWDKILKGPSDRVAWIKEHCEKK